MKIKRKKCNKKLKKKLDNSNWIMYNVNVADGNSRKAEYPLSPQGVKRLLLRLSVQV